VLVLGCIQHSIRANPPERATEEQWNRKPA
jgi:hypothetical protein